MKIEDINALRMKKFYKDAERKDSSRETRMILEGMVSDLENLSLEEIREMTKRDYIREFDHIPGTDIGENIKDALNALNQLIDAYETDLSSGAPIMELKRKLAEDERKMGILLQYLADVLLSDYPDFDGEFEENLLFSVFTEHFMNYFNDSRKVLTISDYYKEAIIYFRFIALFVQNAHETCDRDAFFTAAYWIGGPLVLRTDFMRLRMLR